MTEFTKILSRPEARHRYLHIKKDQRSFFPDMQQSFKIIFDGKTFEMKINHKDDIMTGQLYERFRFLEGDRIILTKKKNGMYELKAPDTKLYPDIR
jgi:hypothetical protein